MVSLHRWGHLARTPVSIKPKSRLGNSDGQRFPRIRIAEHSQDMLQVVCYGHIDRATPSTATATAKVSAAATIDGFL